MVTIRDNLIYMSLLLIIEDTETYIPMTLIYSRFDEKQYHTPELGKRAITYV